MTVRWLNDVHSFAGSRLPLLLLKIIPIVMSLLYTKLPLPSPSFTLKQLLYEAASWRRLLIFLSDENNLLKDRLSEVLKDRGSDMQLADAERFQSSFVQEDELLQVLKMEIAEIERLARAFGNKEISHQRIIERKLKSFRSNILYFESQFGRLQTVFNDYLRLELAPQ